MVGVTIFIVMRFRVFSVTGLRELERVLGRALRSNTCPSVEGIADSEDTAGLSRRRRHGSNNGFLW